MKYPFILILALAAFLAACAPNIETRGHVLDTNWKERIHEGLSTRDDIMAEFGSPSTISTFGDETWYYITLQRRNRAFLKPTIAEGQVLRLVFNADGTVKSVENFDRKDMKDFAIATRTTPTEGHQMTVVEQTLGNLGRFNSPQSQTRATSNRR